MFPILANDFPFKQPLVDRAELLDPEIPVVDVPPPRAISLERKRINHVGHHRVAQPNTGEQGSAVAVEQPAVVGRQADRGITRIDGAA